MKKFVLTFLLFLAAVPAAAQQAVVLDLGNGNYIGIFLTPDGKVYSITKLTIVKTNDPQPSPVTKPVRATYVYEKDQGGVPSGVASALMKLNAQTPPVLASEFEEDTVDGTGQVPDQYAKALEAARKAGLPALVVQDAAGNVVRTVPKPTTEAQVMDAMKP